MNNNGTSKITLIILFIIIILLVVILGLIIIFPENENNNDNLVDSNLSSVQELESEDVNVVPTMLDKISENSMWCSTFQLVWNDMQDNLVDGNVVFSEPNEMVDNLNLQTFTEEDISEEYYYKKWGLMTYSLKSEIEKAIKDKFDETSDILDLFEWTDESDNYFFYSMLKREFEFENEFTILENNKFENIENVEYFGINNETEEIVREQVEVLYYNDESDFAVLLNTKDNDQITLIRNPEGENFQEIYDNCNRKANEFEGNVIFGTEDTLSIPNLDMDVLREYKELENKTFITKDGSEIFIDKAIQTIKMNLDNEGGSIKSEAAIAAKELMMILDEEPRNFEFTGKFAIFLKESTKEVPYFAANIENITLFK